MTVTHTYTQEELDEILSVPGAREDSAVIVAIHQAQAQEVTALEATVAAAMEHAASSQLLIEAGKAAGKPHFCETCYKCFARRADRDRHTNSVHLKIKAFVCPFLKKVEGKKERKPCGKAYAQKTSLTVHMLTHKTAEEDKKPFICCMALETGLSCLKRFGDPSSFSRHRREQHKGATYQCPFPGCLDRAKKPKRIKRQSEFKKHLVEKHNLTLEELRLFQVLDSDNFEPTAGPSKPRKTTRKARSHKSRLPSPPPMYSYAASPAAYSSESPAPPSYSATPYAGEIPAICASSEDGYASTPGLTLCSPSPSPSVREAACEFNAEPSVPPPCYPGFERCPGTSGAG
ncbi:hypothetical protein C8Q73DRAFT_329834 [Cubamyces lactineus]|nr:hypothetical protein C8Q73DRAFT_329834 [Cubamyces lactineus]